jgi:hypothetical protein
MQARCYVLSAQAKTTPYKACGNNGQAMGKIADKLQFKMFFFIKMDLRHNIGWGYID